MYKQLATWQLIYKSLQQHFHVMLLYVLESNGSSPGRQGFFMAVNAQGEMEGSIGGGIMEHKFVEMALDKMKHDYQEASVRKQIHDKTAAKNQSGMICSGEQTNFLYTVQESDVLAVESIIKCLAQKQNGVLTLSSAGISFSNGMAAKNDFNFSYQSEEEWLYEEQVGYKNHLYIIGAGHCATAFSRIMSMMDFYIHLIDDRQGLNTFEQNDLVHEKTIVEDYGALTQIISQGKNIYVVIMTFGYRTDDVAIRSLIGKEFKYLGILGSSKKIEKMFTTYHNEGISDTWLNCIHAPIGINIKSETPEEIAISIAAEIIKIKNDKRN
jgi:xanthine dehydrogenase accessory factor